MFDTNRIEINLLKERNKQHKRQKIIAFQLQMVSGVVLAVYIVVLVIVAGISKTYDLRLSNMEKKIQAKELGIAKLKPIESMYNLVVNKYEIFDETESARLPTADTVTEVVGILPDKTQASSIEFGNESEGVRVTIKAFSLYEVISMLTILEDQVMSGSYDLVGISSLDRDETGAYVLDVNFGGSVVSEAENG